ncbi:hypothetical protein [Streptomyces daliensis]|uniref:Tetratricopeptide repeat protein n=1 Tax=Streptomyces daliensis TaxID=299421 RepID=A0A8T4IZ85_9ACTN|nr:hypothetical protein [Streptomyces daliensis]
MDQTGIRIASGVAVWIFAAFGGLLIVLLSRAVTSAAQYLRGQGRILPLVVRPDPGDGETGSGNGGDGSAAARRQACRELAAHLAVHLSATSNDSLLAPGAASPTPVAPSPQASSTPHGWLESVVRLAVSRPRAFHVHLTEMEPVEEGLRRVSVRIVRAPQGQIVAATVVEKPRDEQLVETLACYTTVSVRGLPAMRRRIPRWERWDHDVRGYARFRHGVTEQEKAQAREQARPLPAPLLAYSVPRRYAAALRAFADAAEYSPGNLTLRLHQAALHERVGSYRPKEYAKAIDIYQRCTELWPGHIETAYRTAIAYSRGSTPVRRGSPRLSENEMERLHDTANRHFDDLERRLRRRALARCWARTVVPGGRWNPGERRYWSSWLTPLPLPARRSRRSTFRGAIVIARAGHTMGGALRTPDDSPRLREIQREVETAFERVARQVMSGSRGPGHLRLLYPQRGHSLRGGVHDAAWHATPLPGRPTSRFWGPLRRPGVGWLAHYNAACFLALAIPLAPAFRPGRYADDGQWSEDCARAALNQLDNSLRTPDTELTTGWILHDADLQALWKTELGARWASFMGVPLSRAR